MASPLTATFSSRVGAVCIGSGRFLRAVLVPVLQGVGSDVILFQTRGISFANTCIAAGGFYEVDTIHHDGSTKTDVLKLEAVGSLAREDDRSAFLALPSRLPALRFIGLGVTDAAFVEGSSVMRDLAMFLHACWTNIPGNTISIINTDNVPLNGEVIKRLVLQAQWAERPTGETLERFTMYLNEMVHFHNTMVDRLTSHRPENDLVPLAEPWPSKVLCIQDSIGVLDRNAFEAIGGVYIRPTRESLLLDQKLKLRVANATSSALVYVLSLSRFRTNNEARLLPDVLQYRDQLFDHDILPSLLAEGAPEDLVKSLYNEWKIRSSHPHFGLVNLWVTQNAWMHFNARLFSTIRANVTRDIAYRSSPAMTFLAASILRFLTPTGGPIKRGGRLVYRGRMDAPTASVPAYGGHASDDWIYGSDLHADLSSGEYEFADAPNFPVAERLAKLAPAPHRTPEQTARVVYNALGLLEGFDPSIVGFQAFADDVSRSYEQLTSGRAALEVLQDVIRH